MKSHQNTHTTHHHHHQERMHPRLQESRHGRDEVQGHHVPLHHVSHLQLDHLTLRQRLQEGHMLQLHDVQIVNPPVRLNCSSNSYMCSLSSSYSHAFKICIQKPYIPYTEFCRLIYIDQYTLHTWPGLLNKSPVTFATITVRKMGKPNSASPIVSIRIMACEDLL